MMTSPLTTPSTSIAHRLLQLLNDGRCHSGEALGRTLNMTRSAVWKIIQKWRALGVDIQSLPHQGYQMPYPLELLTLERITAALDPPIRVLLDECVILDKIHSTNDYLLSRVATHPTQTIAAFAEYQTQARGRCGRPWIAPFGTNLYFSLLWHFSKDPVEMMGLSLAMAVAVFRMLQHYGITQDITLKWPNDVLWKGHKLAGILIEMIAESHTRCAVVVGIGLNTRMPATYADQIHTPWTDIYQITHTPPQRNQLAGLLLNEVIQALQSFDQHRLHPFLAEWRANDETQGKKVILRSTQETITGIMKTISDEGELILVDDSGVETHFLSGELSLRLTE